MMLDVFNSFRHEYPQWFYPYILDRLGKNLLASSVNSRVKDSFSICFAINQFCLRVKAFQVRISWVMQQSGSLIIVAII